MLRKEKAENHFVLVCSGMLLNTKILVCTGDVSFDMYGVNFSLQLFNNQTLSPKGLRVNSPQGKAKWAIDPWPLRAKGLIVFIT